ncbi:MAG: hypothetical protein LBT26_09565 [Clostridiales Family XIII bacterium]|jgi:hypothetical protein|nr:hypothetical protein [Clostridiales Family XIII bacterium]
MEGREPKLDNDLFFVCAVIEHIARTTANRRADVVRAIGEKKLSHIFELADVYHCEPVENTAADLIESRSITKGDFDNVAACKYNVPYFMDIARVYMRLIVDVVTQTDMSPITALISVYTSRVSDKIDDYNSSMYFENPQYLYESYIAGEPL